MPRQLREYRLDHGRMTQCELADLVGLSTSIVRDAEREPDARIRRVTDKSFERIFRKTGVGPVSAWFEEPEAR